MSRDANDVKAAVGPGEFARILEELGATLSPTQRERSSCPIHRGEKTDTLHFNEKAGVIVWTCFKGCGKPGGDVFDLVACALGIPFSESVEWVGERVGVSDSTPPRLAPAPQKPAQVPDVSLERFARMKRLWGRFAPSDAQGERYLQGRKIEPDPDAVRFNLGETGDEEADRLAGYGFRIAVPLRKPDGEIRSFSFRLARDLSDAEKEAHPDWNAKTNLKGDTGGALYSTEPVSSWAQGDAVFIAEGITDYLAVTGLGYLATPEGNRVRVIGIPGAAQAGKLVDTLGPDALKGRPVLIALDNDPNGTGEKHAAQLARALRAIGVKPFRIRTEKKDVCLELSSASDSPIATFTQLLRAAGEAGPWNPDAPNASEEWAQGLAEWEGSIEKKGISTGFPTVDELLGGGFWDRRSYVIAGPSGTGKSALALTMAWAIAEQRIPVLYVSYELEPFEIRARLVAHETDIFYGKVCTPSGLSEYERKRVREAWGKLAQGIGKRIFIRVPGPGGEGPKPGSVAWIHAQAQAITEAFGKPPVVFVDYLQPAAAFADGYDPANLRIAVGKLSLDLRQLSRDLGSSIVILSSIPRSAYLSPVKSYQLPEMSALKESGEIEFGADSVGFIWPEEADWNTHEKEGVEREKLATRPMLFVTVKGRISGTGRALLTWNPPLGTFEDAGRPARKEKREKPSSAKGKGKPDLTVDALGVLFTQHGKADGEGRRVIERDRLLKIALDEFTCSRKTVDGILAKHPGRFEEEVRDGKKLVIYRRGGGEE